jgi:PhnB protein
VLNTKITPHISVPNAKMTIEVYKKLFGAKLVDHMPFDRKIGAEMGLPEGFDYENSTMHAVLDFKGTEVYVADSIGEKTPGPVEVVLDFESREEIEAVWARVKEMNLTVIMELEQQFWGALYGRFIDEDKVGWQLNHNLSLQ